MENRTVTAFLLPASRWFDRPTRAALQLFLSVCRHICRKNFAAKRNQESVGAWGAMRPTDLFNKTRRQRDGPELRFTGDLGLEGIVSKRLIAVYRSGPSRTWIKVKNPKAPAATRAIDGTF